MPIVELRTERLLMRAWRESDRVPFSELNADPVVMEHLPATLDRNQSDEVADNIRRSTVIHGFGLWALELLDTGEFIGFTGLTVPRFQAPFMPAVEIGWRLAASAWGKGLAFEAASRAAGHAFTTLELPEIVSFTTPSNQRSWRLMERLGMTHDPADDFAHPLLPEDHPLSHHVLYRLRRDDWLAQAMSSPRSSAPMPRGGKPPPMVVTGDG